ncbi:MAG: NADPH-dependent glutamate synthase [Planctomycetes bacterium]|nr:NADPH-dependent glutamate synthase [Planctomycetota bacterium]
MYQIVRRASLNDVTFLWDVFAPDVARSARPGQFVMIRLDDDGERIPLTIADYDARRGTVTLVVQALGRTTVRMQRDYAEGDWFRDFVGPLGLASEVEPFGHVVLVGGGLGVAPIFPQVRALAEAGNTVTAVVGFRSKDLVFWEDRFRPYCTDVVVCTDDGSAGRKGLVTDALVDLCRGASRPDRVIAVGPLPMMRACAEATRPFGVPTVASLNAIMVDGTGMCGSCRVTVGGEIRFACVDGPEFDAHAVAFDELMARQRRFGKLEHAASEDYAHVCKAKQTLVTEGKRNYKKIKDVDPKAHCMPERDAGERAHNFLEVNLGYAMTDALAEAERCLQCQRPTCVTGCPVGVDIPGFIRKLLVRDLEGARDAIHGNNLFPSICGRVCPQELQCESQCILGRKVEPVAIGRLERFVGDHAPPAAASAPVPKDPSLGKVAIVGSGPAGLACAGDLARQGVDVTVYEALHVLGGVLRYGIPSFRLPRDIIARELESLSSLGVRFETNKVVGKTFTLEQLRGELGYAAVFVGTGAGYPIFLGIEGESAGQVYSANEFLTRVNLMGAGSFPYRDTPVGMGDDVVVLGAGNTAMDCLRVARRLGARNVHCVYRRTEAEAPGRLEEIRHAKEEGVQFRWLRAPQRIEVDAQGDVTALVCQVMEMGEPDASGRRKPVPVEGEFETIVCDTVIYALGTRANPIVPQSATDLSLDKRGYIAADPVTQATNLPGVFAGGDIVTGGATVILALGAGRRAAKGVLRWLRDGEWPPRATTAAAASDAAAADAEARCPRCHGALEGEDAYVCCSGESIAWRCTSCHKIAEGFAFPYGRCPACGGTLEAGGADPARDDGTRRAIRHAFEIELGGMAFYARGAELAEDDELSALFGSLAEMERGHLATLCRRYHVRAPDAVEPADDGWLAVHAGRDALPSDAEGLMDVAVELERRARDVFASRARELPEGSPEWRLYKELEAEEYEHVALLETERARLRQGKGSSLLV